MTDKELLYISTIAQYNSFSKAAQELFISQPSLSQIVQKLEKRLAVELFERGNSSIKLTESGEKYLVAALKIQNLYKNMQLEIGGLSSDYSGQIRLGITPYLGTMILPELILEYNKIYPNIKLEIIEDNSSSLEELTENGRLDITIMHKPLKSSNLEIDSIISDDFLLVASKNNSLLNQVKEIDSETLAKLDFISIAPEHRIHEISNHIFSLAKVSPKIIYNTKSFETACSMAALGLGVSFVPSSYSKYFISNYDCVYYKLPKKWQGFWELCIAYKKGSELPMPCQAINQILQNFIKNHSEVFGEF